MSMTICYRIGGLGPGCHENERSRHPTAKAEGRKGEEKEKMEKAWLTVQEAADYLKVARSTVYRWAREGRLPIFKLAKGVARVRLQDLERFLEEARPLYDYPDETPEKRETELAKFREYTRQEIREFLKADQISPETIRKLEQLLSP